MNNLLQVMNNLIAAISINVVMKNWKILKPNQSCFTLFPNWTKLTYLGFIRLKN